VEEEAGDIHMNKKHITKSIMEDRVLEDGDWGKETVEKPKMMNPRRDKSKKKKGERVCKIRMK
jgi:hypothetical protein